MPPINNNNRQANQPTSMQQAGNEIAEWYKSIPPVTRFLFTAFIVVSLLGNMKVIDVRRIIYFYPLVRYKFQLWRLFTCFFYVTFGFPFLLLLFFLYTYSLQLEKSHFTVSKPADYTWFLLVVGSLLLIYATVFDAAILGDALISSIVYLWSQINSEQTVTFMFGFRFKAKYLPAVMFVYELILGSLSINSLAGYVASHFYYYFTSIYPTLGQRQPLTSPLATPNIMRSLLPDKQGGFETVSGETTFKQPLAGRGESTTRHHWGSGRKLE